MQKSRSQTDMRRKSQELEKNTAEYSENHVKDYDEQCGLAKPELKIPKFMISCLNYLEKNGLHAVGLFRVSPSKKRVKQVSTNVFLSSAVSNNRFVKFLPDA